MANKFEGGGGGKALMAGSLVALVMWISNEFCLIEYYARTKSFLMSGGKYRFIVVKTGFYVHICQALEYHLISKKIIYSYLM